MSAPTTFSSAAPDPRYSGWRVLVLGASGYVGTNLVPRLVESGYRVRATARNPKVLEGRDWENVELVAADVLQPATLEAALRDVDVAYYLVHSMAAGRDFGRLDLEAADHFARAAARAQVKRIVYLGGLIPPKVDSEHPCCPDGTRENIYAPARCRSPKSVPVLSSDPARRLSRSSVIWSTICH